jgi:hypothetical protein
VIYFFIGNQINFIENISALSIQEVYKMTQKHKRQRNKRNPKIPKQKPAQKPSATLHHSGLLLSLVQTPFAKSAPSNKKTRRT